MIPRFSLYRDISQWDKDIQEDPNGQWVRWKDVMAYVPVTETYDPALGGPSEYTPMYQATDKDLDQLEEADPLDETTEDLYELLTGEGPSDINDLDD